MMVVTLSAALLVQAEAGGCAGGSAACSCFLRGGVSPTLAKCDPGTVFDTWLLSRQTGNWTAHQGANCYAQHGATWATGDLSVTNKKTYTLAACEAVCRSNPQCNAVTVGGPPPPPPPAPCAGGITFNPAEQIPGPTSPDNVSAWRKAMNEWQSCVRSEMNYSTAQKAYDVPELKWTQTSYIQPQMHPYDRLFFDPAQDNYTVQRWLDDVNARYGGVDSLLMWPTYTNIGTDDRSQFDLFEAMPGGLAGVKRAVDELHAAGVKVLIPFNPWDAGTLRCGPGMATCGGNSNLTAETAKNASYCDSPATAAAPGVCDARIMDSLIKEMNADGFNGDTMGLVPREFFDVSMDLKHPVAIEPEGGGQATGTVSPAEGGGHPGIWDTMGWGYWKYPYVPSVDSWKWLDPRRMTNICERWSKNHTNALQYALFNGDGFESWENVWGTWNGITERDGEQIRRVGTLLRFLGGRGYLQSTGWVPHSPTTDPYNLFASYWPSDKGDGSAAWTVVNRMLVKNSTHGLENISASNYRGMKFYDLYNGIEVAPSSAGTLLLEVERYGAVLATAKGPDEDTELKTLLSTMAGYARVPLASLSAKWTWEQGRRNPMARAETPNSTAGMTKIPGGPFRFSAKGIEIEGSGSVGDPRSFTVNPFGMDFQYEWESQPNRYHTQWVNVPEFWLDKTPVTHGDFAEYLNNHPDQVPTDRYHYLKNWDWSDDSKPKPYPGNETLPVTYVGYAEAKAYCTSQGKRLPHEEEWQFAANGGGDSTQTYPWGSTAPNETNKLAPPQRTGNVFPGPEKVGSYPAGASPFGILDMVGNVWQMTDEYEDTHTRSVILKGGSNYRPSSSIWYFPLTDGNCATGHCGMTTNFVHNKYFLMNSRYERAGTVGFRCAADIPGTDKPLDCGGKPLCGRFNAPAARVQLPESGTEEWIVWGGAKSARSDDGRRSISEAVSGTVGDALVPCNGTQSTFIWSAGTTSMGSCIANGTDGILFNVSARSTKVSSLMVYAGSVAAAAGISATLIDGDKTTVFEEHVNATASDIAQKMPFNLRWELAFKPKHPDAVLMVNVSAPYLPVPPPPPAPAPPVPAPCFKALCGAVSPQKKGEVDLSAVGISDWTHYGLGNDPKSVNRKCKVSRLIQPLKVTDGAMPSFNNDGMTYSWHNGGFDPGTPAAAQVGSAVSTPDAVWSKAGKGAPGGFIFAVEIPPVDVATNVYVYMGVCGNLATLNATLFSMNGSATGTFEYTMPTKTTGPYFIATLTIPPAKTSAGKRKLSGQWTQVASDAKTVARNIQFHSIAVDAGSPIADGAEVTCSHTKNTGAATGGVILQAAVLQ
eukprot:SAG11_NODE_1237_length_5426_cov_4.878543_4_plen_1325_part_00